MSPKDSPWYDPTRNELHTADPNADYGRLWLAVHNYLIAQATQESLVIARAYAELVEAHNLIHERYIAEQPPLRIAGLDE
jgi:hypothetical protein